MINCLSLHQPLHFHNTVLTLLYFTEEMRSPKTHRVLNANACYCRVRQKTSNNLNPSVTGEQSSLNRFVTQDTQPGCSCAHDHVARPIAQDFCQGILLSASSIGVRKRDKSCRTTLYTQMSTLLQRNNKTGANSEEGKVEATLSFKKPHTWAIKEQNQIQNLWSPSCTQDWGKAWSQASPFTGSGATTPLLHTGFRPI